MYVKCLKFNDLVTVTVIFLKIAVCLMLLLNTKPWFIIGGWLLLSSAINWTSIRFMVISTIFYSGLSPHLYQVVALSNRSATDVVRILLTISPTAIKHCSQICWQTLLYSRDYTNTYYHPALSHIKRKKRIWRKSPRWFWRTQMAWSRANAFCSYGIRSGASCSKHG